MDQETIELFKKQSTLIGLLSVKVAALEELLTSNNILKREDVVKTTNEFADDIANKLNNTRRL